MKLAKRLCEVVNFPACADDRATIKEIRNHCLDVLRIYIEIKMDSHPPKVA